MDSKKSLFNKEKFNSLRVFTIRATPHPEQKFRYRETKVHILIQRSISSEVLLYN